ncbi:MAG: SGNH/GDSL hydrolase family protein [Saprospiraceae bacterium]
MKHNLRLLALFAFNGILLLFIIFTYNLGHYFYAVTSEFNIIYPKRYKLLLFIAKNCSTIIGIFVIFLILFNYFIFKKWRIYLWKKEIAVALLSTILTLGLTELGLRLYGFAPGQSYNQWFKEVDDLVLYKGYDTDSLGIFKVDPDAGEYLSNQLANAADKSQWDWEIPINSVGEIYTVKNDFFKVYHGLDHNIFSEFISTLKNKPVESLDQFEKSVLEYSLSPINKDGFKSIPFTDYPSDRKKILLLGDSFTWGHNTPNITNGFADVLLSNGYVVYNTGISGTDPSQYLAIAKKYIPLLKPDYVIVNFFLGNDVFYFDRPVLPQTPIFIATNAGNLLTCPIGNYILSADSLYHFNMLQNHIPTNGNKFYEMCAKSVITTLGWYLLNRLNITFYYNHDRLKIWEEGESNVSDIPVANSQIKEIADLASKNNVSFYLSIIPEVKKWRLTRPNEYKNLFIEQEYFMPTELSIWDYNFEDAHFNKSGHEKYAEHILSIIK